MKWVPVHFGEARPFFLIAADFLSAAAGVGARDRQMGGVVGRRGSQHRPCRLGLMAAVGRAVMYSAAAAGRQGRT